MNIRNRVKNLIKTYDTTNPFELIDYLGIEVVKLPLCGVRKGFYIKRENLKTIFIDSDLPKKEQLIVAAHELGHAVLHEESNILFLNENTFFSSDKFEVQANTFAAEILLDDSIFETYMDYSINTIAQCECIHENFVQLKYNSFCKSNN